MCVSVCVSVCVCVCVCVCVGVAHVQTSSGQPQPFKTLPQFRVFDFNLNSKASTPAILDCEDIQLLGPSIV